MRKRLKRIGWTTYVIPISVIILLFVIAGYFLIRSIESFFIQQKIDDSNRLADYHMSRLSSAIAADKTVDELLEARLLTAANIIMENKNRLSNEYLEEMLDKLQVDKIYWYNSSGEIIYSASNYLGWQAKEGHPTYDFMISDKRLLIEPIRPDEDSGVHIKYGQLKAENGEFVQVGILADNIYQLTRFFSLEKIIEISANDRDILHMHFLDTNNNIVYCHDESKKNHYELGSAEINSIEKKQALLCEKNH